MGLPVDKYQERVPWLSEVLNLPHPTIIKLAGNGQSLPVVGAISGMALLCLKFDEPVPAHV